MHILVLISCYSVFVIIESNDLAIRVLERIQHDLSGLREDVNGLQKTVGGLRETVGGLQETVGGLRETVGGLQETVAAQSQILTEHGERLAAVEVGLGDLRKDNERQFGQLRSDILLTNASFDVIRERLSFFERAATAATEGRARLDDRVGRHEGSVNEFGERVGKLEVRVDALELG